MFTLPKLPYSYSSLEPYIDEATMTIHHTKHHQAYIDNLNKALESYPELQSKSIEELLSGEIPQDIKTAVVNNGGGHFNHSFFWNCLTSEKVEPTGALLEAINKEFQSLENFKAEFTKKALGVFGSGWVWLLKDESGKLLLKRHSFQNPPLKSGVTPILGLDVWEHAYYLKYQNRRADYVSAWWNVVNWQFATKNYEKNS